MKGLHLVISVAWLARVVLGCTSNNCLRALSNTRADGDATADCLSVLQVTVTPTVRTYTATVFVTSSVPTLTIRTYTHDLGLHRLSGRNDDGAEQPFEVIEEREVTTAAKSIPTYASACGSLAAFSSACSCMGISAETVTVKASSKTATRTTTRTVGLSTVRPSLGNHTVSMNNTSGRWGNSTLAKVTSHSASLSKTTGTSTSTRPAVKTSMDPTLKKQTTLATSKSTLKFSNSSEPQSSQSNRQTQPLAAANTSPWNASVMPTTLLTSSTKARLSNTSTLLFSQPKSSKAASIPTSTSRWNISAASSAVFNSTTSAGFLNSSVALPTSIGAVTAIHWVNATTVFSSLPYSRVSVSATNSLAYNSSGRWRNSSVPAAASGPNMTKALWLNTSLPTAAPNVTTGRWLNTTHLPVNTTSARWRNSTMRANFTTPVWQNTSAKATPTPTPTVDLTCGETSTPFALQVSQPGSVFDKWWAHVVGDGVLFTSVSSSASAFSVEGTGHLCAVGHLVADGKPRLASAGILDDSSSVWMLGQDMLDWLNEDYGALNCTAGSTLSCAANATSHWIGCGLQLALSRDAGATVPYLGLECSSIGLNVVPFGNGTVGPGNGTARGAYRNGTAMGAQRSGQMARRYGAAYLQATS